MIINTVIGNWDRDRKHLRQVFQLFFYEDGSLNNNYVDKFENVFQIKLNRLKKLIYKYVFEYIHNLTINFYSI